MILFMKTEFQQLHHAYPHDEKLNINYMET